MQVRKFTTSNGNYKKLPYNFCYNNYGNKTIMALELMYKNLLMRDGIIKGKKTGYSPPKTEYHNQIYREIKPILDRANRIFLPENSKKIHNTFTFQKRDTYVLESVETDVNLIDEINKYNEPGDKIICTLKSVIPKKIKQLEDDLIEVSKIEKGFIGIIMKHFLGVLKSIERTMPHAYPDIMSYNIIGGPSWNTSCSTGKCIIDAPNKYTFIQPIIDNLDIFEREELINWEISNIIPSPSFRILIFPCEYTNEEYYALQVLPDPDKHVNIFINI